MREQDRLGQMLVEWAEWRQKVRAAGYPTTDILWRAQFGKGGEIETIPAGLYRLYANPEVRRVNQAVEALRPEHPRAMEFLEAFHTVGLGPLVSLGYTPSLVSRELKSATNLVRHEMRFRG